MKKAKVIILRTAGTNCDKETAYAFKMCGAETELVHINSLVMNDKNLGDYQILAIPGGFTYGDDVASGKILANELKSKLKNQILQFISDGKIVIGICNGFQVLVKMGLLPDTRGKQDGGIEATLSLNDSGKFNAEWVYLKRSKNDKCIWIKDLPEVIDVPIAHAEGKFIPKDESIIDILKKNEQIVFRYTDKTGTLSGVPYNPNGSIDDIAGICDTTGRILGMMPHPERHISYLQHPNWRRNDENKSEPGIGLKIFDNGVKYTEENII
ncbi:MAG: phosphoribosylformylglycinamidine synthase I [Candidatus Omnitrophota bacterium]